MSFCLHRTLVRQEQLARWGGVTIDSALKLDSGQLTFASPSSGTPKSKRYLDHAIVELWCDRECSRRSIDPGLFPERRFIDLQD
jgi:hypothetical protein